MSTYNINKIKLPNGDICNLKDSNTIDPIKISSQSNQSNITLPSAAKNYPIDSFQINLTPTQEGEGTPSVNNIRNITGCTHIQVERNNKNLYAQGDQTFKAIQLITLSNPLPSGTYTLSAVITTTNTNSQGCLIRLLTQNEVDCDTATHNYLPSKNGARVAQTWHLSQPAYKMYLYAGISYPDAASHTATYSNIQIEYGEWATEYEPYSTITIPIDFDPIYYGKIDLVNGLITQYTAMAVYDGSADEPWRTNDNDLFYISYDSISPTPKKSQFLNQTYFLSNLGVPGSRTEGVIPTKVMITWSGILYAYLGAEIGISSMAEWRAWLAQHPLQVVYQLQTPIVSKIPSNIIKTIYGTNYFNINHGTISNIHYAVDLTATLSYGGFIRKNNYATTTTGGIVKVNGYGLKMDNGQIKTDAATTSEIKTINSSYKPLVPQHQHEATFYGLATAAGDTTQKTSSNTVGHYTDSAIAAILHMLGIDTLIGNYEADAIADKDYAIGELFMYNGKLYKVTQAISLGGTITPGTNSIQTNLINSLISTN